MKNTIKKSGIYVFIYKAEYFYVGQSIDVNNRILTHKKDIYLKRHPNLSNFHDYSEDDFVFIIPEYCENYDLNKKEAFYHDLYSKEYKSLNKATCGIQKTPDFDRKINKGVDYSITYINEHFYIGNYKIKKHGKLHSLSDLCLFFLENSNFKIRISDLINRTECIDRLSALKNIEIKGDTIKILKDMNAYKVFGARENKVSYCDYDVFITILYYCCPQLSASLAIYITNMIFKTR